MSATSTAIPPFTLVEIDTNEGSGEYTFHEVWLTGGVYAEKVGGIYGGTLNPGVSLDSHAFVPGDFALCRSASGEGGLRFELAGFSPGAAAPAFSGAHVYNTAAIVVNSGAVTLLTFNTEDYDTDAYHSLAVNTGRLTVPSAGYYRVGGFVAFTESSVGARYLQVLRNGTELVGQSCGSVGPTGSAGIVTHLNASVDFACAAGDYWELGAYQTSGGLLLVEATGAHKPRFWIQRLGDV